MIGDPRERATASELLQLEYFRTQEAEKSLSDADQAVVVESLRKFMAKNKFQSAVQSFMAQMTTSKKEMERVKTLFMALDEEKDGFLSFEELLKGLDSIFGSL